MPNSRIAIYAGSFDPITRGHEDLMHRSLEYVDRLIVAVATNSSKQPLFKSGAARAARVAKSRGAVAPAPTTTASRPLSADVPPTRGGDRALAQQETDDATGDRS